MHVRKARYGIDERTYQALLSDSRGVCAICGKTPKSSRDLVLDHNHATGQVRGFLCRSCNGALGCLEPRLHDVLRYLKRSISVAVVEGVLDLGNEAQALLTELRKLSLNASQAFERRREIRSRLVTFPGQKTLEPLARGAALVTHWQVDPSAVQT